MSSQSIHDILSTQGPFQVYEADEGKDKRITVWSFLEGVDISHSGFECDGSDYVTMYKEEDEEIFGKRVYWDYVHHNNGRLRAFIPRVRLAPGKYKIVLASTKDNYFSGQSGVEFDRMYIDSVSMIQNLNLTGEPKIGKSVGCDMIWSQRVKALADVPKEFSDNLIFHCARSAIPPSDATASHDEAWTQRLRVLEAAGQDLNIKVMDEIRVPGDYCIAVSVMNTKSVNANDYFVNPTMISTTFTVEASASTSPQLALKGSSNSFTPKQSISIQVKFPGWKPGDVLMLVPAREASLGSKLLQTHKLVGKGLFSHYYVYCRHDDEKEIARELLSSECTIEFPARNAGSYMAAVGVPAHRLDDSAEIWTKNKHGNFLTYYCGGTSSVAVNVVSLKDA